MVLRGGYMGETITETNTDDVNANDGGGGTPPEVVETPPEKPAANPEQDKALRDLQKYKSRVKELEDNAEKSRLDKLKESEQWQDLSKEWQDKAEASDKRAETLEQSMIYDKKISAVRDFARKSGIKDEALRDLELVALDDVDIEVTSTGRVNVLNADKAVEKLKLSRPHWFGRRGNNVNANEPEVVGGKELTYSDVVKAEEVAKKSGDYGPYKTLLMKYKQKIRG